MKTRIFISTIIIVIIATFFLFFINKKEGSKTRSPLPFSLESNYGEVEKTLKQMIYYEGVELDSILILEAEREVPIQSYISGELLVFFYPDHYCGECTERETKAYSDIAEEFEGKTILLSTTLSRRELFFFKKEQRINGLLYPIYTKEEKIFNEVFEPCFFILDKDLRVSHFFNPDPDHPDLSTSYFEKVRSILESKQ